MKHRIVLTPGAPAVTGGLFAQSTALPDNPGKGGAWIMDAGTSTARMMTPGS
jgi:hypothetical protein